MFRQIHPEDAGFVQPGNGFSQLRDAQNPAAIAYATHMLALHGIQVPHGADPTAMWRVYSAKLAGQRASASQAAAGESPDMGVTPGSIPASLPVAAPRNPIDMGVMPHLPMPSPHAPDVVALPQAPSDMQQRAPAAIAGLMRAILQARAGGGGGYRE